MIVALGLLQTVQHEDATEQRTSHWGLIDVREIPANDFSSLLQIRFGGVARDADILHLTLNDLTKSEGEVALLRAGRSDQEDILPQQVLLHHPSQMLQRLLRVARQLWCEVAGWDEVDTREWRQRTTSDAHIADRDPLL